MSKLPPAIIDHASAVLQEVCTRIGDIASMMMESFDESCFSLEKGRNVKLTVYNDDVHSYDDVRSNVYRPCAHIYH
jgi:hypothetical protein